MRWYDGASVVDEVCAHLDAWWASVSPDGASVVLLDGESFVVISRGLGVTLSPRNTVPATIQALALSPDGALVALCGGGEIQVRETRTGALRWSFEDGRTPAACFHPDGRSLYSIRSNQTLVCWDLSTGFERSRAPLPDARRLSPTLRCSPDGTRLAMQLGADGALLSAADSLAILGLHIIEGTADIGFDAGGDLRAIAVDFNSHRLRSWALLANGEQRLQWTATAEVEFRPAWLMRDGDVLLARSTWNMTRLSIVSAESGEARPLPTLDMRVHVAHVGGRLAILLGDRTPLVVVLELPSGNVLDVLELRDAGANPVHVATTPDDARVAIVLDDGVVLIFEWDCASQRLSAPSTRDSS
ncbi:MAG: WD40 repeat domain-containing protein [Polyangiales bacterium]